MARCPQPPKNAAFTTVTAWMGLEVWCRGNPKNKCRVGVPLSCPRRTPGLDTRVPSGGAHTGLDVNGKGTVPAELAELTNSHRAA